MHGQDHRRNHRDRDRREVFDRIVGHLLVEFGIDHQVGAVHQQRVAVGRGLGRAPGADIAASAGEILDVELRL
jgi:hypothetical protein